jgi:hypothetical protein
MKTLLSLFTLLVLQLSSIAGPLSPELKVLDHYAGTWQGTLSSFPGATIDIQVAWTLDGKFLRHSLSVSAGSSAGIFEMMQMMTFDKAKGVYRSWGFSSTGGSSEAEGTWDPESKTLTWKESNVAAGTLTVSKAVFTDDDTEDYTSVTTDREDKIVQKLKGQKKRVK